MIIDIENFGDHLKVSHFNEEGHTTILNLPIPKEEQFSWKKSESKDRQKDPIWKSWDGTPVKKSYGRNYDKFRMVQLLDEMPAELTAPLWEYREPVKYFVDIEVQITDNKVDSLDVENARNKIISIAIATSQGKIVAMGIDPLASDKIKRIEDRINAHFETLKTKYPLEWTFNYIPYETEFDMLYTFMSRYVPKMSLMTGWNFLGYDWPYIMGRCRNLGIDPKIASPTGDVHRKSGMPKHVLIVDYLEIYKKWDRAIKLKESNSLDYVANAALGIKKIVYEKTLKDLYESDFETFILYNAIDSAILHYVDKRLSTMSTFFKIAYLSKVEINRALSPVWTTEVMMLRKLNERKKVIVDERKDMGEVRKFEGAYVKVPQVGMHEWIACFDFASLYPSIMRQFKISPEVYKGKDLRFIPEHGIKTASGAVFVNSPEAPPILPGIIEDLYARRKSVKKQYMSCVSEMEELTKKLREFD
jgi:DNA polymerase elongation subunit (family B)